jgi:hypothetical protein
MKFRTVVFAILLCLTASRLLGQAGAATVSEIPATPEDIRKLFDVMQIRNQMKLIMQQVSQQIRSMEHEQIKKSERSVSEEDIAKIDAISDEVLKGISVEGLLDDMIPVYQKHLNKSDVNAMVGFYSTPTGQKILKEMPAMTTEGMQAMQPHLRQMMADANSQIEKMVKEQLQEKKQDHTVKPDTVKN